MDDVAETHYAQPYRRIRKARTKQSEALMKQHSIKWTTGPDGRRAMVIRSKTPASAVELVRSALRREA